MKLHKWFNWNIKPKIISLTLETKNKSKLIGSSDYTNLMMNSTDAQSVDTLGEISYTSVLYQNYIDSLALNLIKHKKVCIGESSTVYPMQTGSKNLGRFLVI